MGNACPLTSVYAVMNRAAFNTRRTSSTVPPGATRGRPSEPSPHKCQWDTSGAAPAAPTLAERCAMVRQRMEERKAAARAALLSPQAYTLRATKQPLPQ